MKYLVFIAFILVITFTVIKQDIKINSLEEELNELTEAVIVLAQSDSIIFNLQESTVQVLYDHIKNPPYPAEHSPSR